MKRHRTLAILCFLLLGQASASAENPGRQAQASKPAPQAVTKTGETDEFFNDYHAFYKDIYSRWHTPHSKPDWKETREGSKKLILAAYQQKEKSPICVSHALLLLPYLGLLAASNKGNSQETYAKLLDKGASFPKDSSIQQKQELLLGLNRVRFWHVNELLKKKAFDEIATFNGELDKRQWCQQLQASVPERKFLLKSFDVKQMVSIYVTLPSQWCTFDDLRPQVRAAGPAPAPPEKYEAMTASLESILSGAINVEDGAEISYVYCGLASDKDRDQSKKLAEINKQRGEVYALSFGSLNLPMHPALGKVISPGFAGTQVLSTRSAHIGQAEGFILTTKQSSYSGPTFNGTIGKYVVTYLYTCQGPFLEKSWKQYGAKFLNSEIVLAQNEAPASK